MWKLTEKTSIPVYRAVYWYAHLVLIHCWSHCYVLLQSDGLGGFLSALFTVAPLSIFAQVRSLFLTGHTTHS